MVVVGGLDDRVHPSAPLVVLEPDDDDVGDLRVVDECGLHLGGEHVGAAGDDHVDAPVDDVQVALGFEPAEVAAGGEAVDRTWRQRRAADVVEHPAAR